MLRAPAAVVAIVASVLGAVATLAIAKGAGWLDAGDSRRVVVTVPREVAAAGNAPAAVVKARPGTGSIDAIRVYRKRSPGVVTVWASFGSADVESQGSGFVVSPRGYVLTNAHVVTSAPNTPVRGADRLYVEFSDGDRVQARLVGWDIFDDVGLLKVKASDHALSPVPLGDSAAVTVGEPVAAIGSPFGNESTLTVGVVSAIRRSISSLAPGFQIVDAIQTDAAINHGNSGGPLFDAAGRAIGINAQIRSTSGANEGVGFAVPINAARRSMLELIASGRVSYGYIGVQTDDLTPSLARHFGYAARYGAVVECVREDSPAARAGLRGGSGSELFNGVQFVRGADVIVAANGRPVRGGDDVVRFVSQRLRPGEVVRFAIVRGDARRTVSVRLGERSSQPSSAC